MSVEQEVVKAMLHYETESVKVIPPELIHAYHLASRDPYPCGG